MASTPVHVSSAELASTVHPIPDSWQIKLLYDGDCPLCLHEVNFLRRRDGDRGRVAFVNIADANYRPEDHGGIDFETAMGRIHAIRRDGTVLKNVEVFRQIYTLLGLGWVYAITRWPIIGPLVDWLYGFWADRRLAWTGRPDLATILRDRQSRISCDENRCRP